MKRILALAALGLACGSAGMASPAMAQVSFNISVNLMPPALPVYDQPPIPGPDYIWIPGTWAWDDYVQDYYWIPGTWVLAPRPGLLWTPSWWGWQDGAYLYHPGYWGPHVGFYGGVAYGFGYTGSGYQGAYWNGGHVFYNRSVTNITNVHVTNVYNKTVIVNRITNVSYNGGPGGIQARPSMVEQAAMREQHIAPTMIQQQHVQAARSNRQFFATSNHGSPPVAAAARPGQFGGPGIVRPRQAQPYHPAQPPAQAGGPRPGAPGMMPHPATPGNPVRPSAMSAPPSPGMSHPPAGFAPTAGPRAPRNPQYGATPRPNAAVPEYREVPQKPMPQGAVRYDQGSQMPYQPHAAPVRMERPDSMPATPRPVPQPAHAPTPPRPPQMPHAMPPHPMPHPMPQPPRPAAPRPQGGHPPAPPHHEEHR
ncbi:YXWGXW repeat-containing protein [Novosphingobium terrae]|uniref:YXWGXW repeat-containing protein n=1 Tax=Novosphingobium terrae TaxID=2726189 RepID=UPI0019801ACC|nr:YXWGXW repeat-containing protein [Novosphingobium terrae]